MPSLHSRLRYSSRLLARYEQDKVHTNVDIHILVRELLIMRQDIRDILISLDYGLFTNMSPRASRQDENKSRVWKTRWIYPSHSCSRLVSCCLARECKPCIKLELILKWAVKCDKNDQYVFEDEDHNVKTFCQNQGCWVWAIMGLSQCFFKF